MQIKQYSISRKGQRFFTYLFLTIGLLLTPLVNTVAQNTQISTERKKELVYMVQQDCGSCHGMTLKGGLGPSLLPKRMSVLPKNYLIEAVTHGREGTPMPPWEPILSTNEIAWIVEQLQLGQIAQQKP